jgi:ribosome maturation factor RimP
MIDLKQKITDLLIPKLESLDSFLVDIKLINGGSKIEVYIDNDAGIQIKTCEEVSRYIEVYLDNDKEVPEKYVLDVSSPGMENPFKVKRQYIKNIGKTVEVLLNDGTKVEGILTQFTDEDMVLQIHHTPPKKGMKPTIEEKKYQNNTIKSTKKKISF